MFYFRTATSTATTWAPTPLPPTCSCPPPSAWGTPSSPPPSRGGARPTDMSAARSCPRCCSSPTTCTRLAGPTLTWWGSSTRLAGNHFCLPLKLIWMVCQVAQALDDSVTQEVTNHLFQEPGKAVLKAEINLFSFFLYHRQKVRSGSCCSQHATWQRTRNPRI